MIIWIKLDSKFEIENYDDILVLNLSLSVILLFKIIFSLF